MSAPLWRVRVGMRKKFKSKELKHLGENPYTPQVTAVSRSWKSFRFMRMIVRLPQGESPEGMLRLRKIEFVLDLGNSFNRLPAVCMADLCGAALDFTCVILGNAVKL